MADAAVYFIRHDEAQLHSTRGALGQTGLKSPRHYQSCLLIQHALVVFCVFTFSACRRYPQTMAHVVGQKRAEGAR